MKWFLFYIGTETNCGGFFVYDNEKDLSQGVLTQLHLNNKILGIIYGTRWDYDIVVKKGGDKCSEERKENH